MITLDTKPRVTVDFETPLNLFEPLNFINIEITDLVWFLSEHPNSQIYPLRTVAEEKDLRAICHWIEEMQKQKIKFPKPIRDYTENYISRMLAAEVPSRSLNVEQKNFLNNTLELEVDYWNAIVRQIVVNYHGLDEINMSITVKFDLYPKIKNREMRAMYELLT